MARAHPHTDGRSGMTAVLSDPTQPWGDRGKFLGSIMPQIVKSCNQNPLSSVLVRTPSDFQLLKGAAKRLKALIYGSGGMERELF